MPSFARAHAFADIGASLRRNADGNLLPVPQMREDVRHALTGVEVSEIFGEDGAIGQLKKVRFAQKVSALDSLARYLGMFQDGAVASAGLHISLHAGEP